MTDPACKNLEDTLRELDGISPEAPLLALGQTIFWDEPMKAGVAVKLKRLGSARKFVAGVHDTDYFAKLPGHTRGGRGKFRTVAHNDTTTRGLWSAAGEFSALFGSETVVTRELLRSAGLRIEWLNQFRPGFLDEATEAWGWRGIVSLDEHPPTSAELPIGSLRHELIGAFRWATESSLECLAGEGKELARHEIDRLIGKICDAAEDPSRTLSQFYRDLLRVLYEFAANAQVAMETTATTELLRFNRATCSLPRFDLLRLFVEPKSAEIVRKCYDDAIREAPGLYELARFGTGAIPFDLVIPGKGRGTIRLGRRGAVIMTPSPQFLSFKKTPESLDQLADIVEAKYGPNCTVVGKAVTLIGLLAREFVFVFHEKASGYVRFSRKFHQLMAERTGVHLELNPILRVRYSAWDSMRACCSWLRLPKPLQRPFGTEELCAPSFADRWQDVGTEQESILAELGKLRRPVDLIRYLDKELDGSWRRLAEEYEQLHATLGWLDAGLSKVREEVDAAYAEIRATSAERLEAENRKGEHFRERIFEKEPSPEDLVERERLAAEVQAVSTRLYEARHRLKEIRREQHGLTQDPEMRKAHSRRKAIELEAELKRARLICSAVTASRGLANSSLRPSAWWFPMVCPDGLWFWETIDRAECYLEPLG